MINLAYIHLELGNFEQCLVYANLLHKESDCTKFVRQLSFISAANAFLELGKTKEALKFLSKKFDAAEAEGTEKRERERVV